MRLAALVAALAWVAPAPAPADTLIESLPAPAGGTLAVSLDRGEVEVVAHEAPEVRIEAVSRGLGSGNVHFEASPVEGGIRLSGSDDPWLRWIHPGPRVLVRVLVPRDWAVEIATAGGDVTVEGVLGGVTASTRSASIRLVSVAGPVALRTGRGRYETPAPAEDAVALTLSESGRVYREHGAPRRSFASPALGLRGGPR